GFSQGMLLPTIAIIFEQHGLSSSINGIHATALYIGILVASPFMEKPMMKVGYKPFIITGGILVFTSLFAFSLWDSIIFWFILRMIVGIGDQMLHFGSQTWITTTVSEKTRGRSVALYGLSFGLGFAVGRSEEHTSELQSRFDLVCYISLFPYTTLFRSLVFTSLFAFSLWDSIIFWFILRMIVGIGDQMLHFGSQTWITTTVSEKTRGRSVALYGLSFGLGFAVG